MDSPLAGTVSLAAFLLSVPALRQDLLKWKAHLARSDSPKTKDKIKALKRDISTSWLTLPLRLSFPCSVPVVSSTCLICHNVT